jgi:DNA polymerase-3 subunit alpha
MYSAMKFLAACKQYDIKPILGEEFYFDINGDTFAKSPSHLVLLAANEVGIGNLYRLSTLSNFPGGFYRVARLKPTMIKSRSEGLICLTACEKGMLAGAVADDDIVRAKAIMLLLEGLFPKVYIEIMPIEKREGLVKKLVAFATYFKRPYVVTNDVHYVAEGDTANHNLMVMVNTQGRMMDFAKGLWLKSKEEMGQSFDKFGDLSVGMETTIEIVEEVKYG